jgi:hypothetical protein
MAGDCGEKCCSRSALGSEHRSARPAAEPSDLLVQFYHRLRGECTSYHLQANQHSVLQQIFLPSPATFFCVPLPEGVVGPCSCGQVWFAVGAPLLLAVNFVVDKIIFPRVSIEDEIHLNMDERSQSDNDNGGGARNWGIALVAGTVAISMAQLLSTFLRDCAFEFGVH